MHVRHGLLLQVVHIIVWPNHVHLCARNRIFQVLGGNFDTLCSLDQLVVQVAAPDPQLLYNQCQCQNLEQRTYHSHGEYHCTEELMLEGPLCTATSMHPGGEGGQALAQHPQASEWWPCS